MRTALARKDLYNDSNRLDWRRLANSGRLPHGLSSRLETTSQLPVTTPDDLLLDLEDIWQLELSAQSFSRFDRRPGFRGG